MKNELLIIDPQNSFCNPGDNKENHKGSLYVEGADKDMERLANWITKNSEDIDYIGVTLDMHHPNDIAHPTFWKTQDGNFSEPFTSISVADVESGIWIPRFEPEHCPHYEQHL